MVPGPVAAVEPALSQAAARREMRGVAKVT